MTVPRWLFIYLWVAPHALQVVLAAMMIYRKLVRTFPAFFAYTVFEIILFGVLFTIDQSPRFTGEQYVLVQLMGKPISMALRFAIVHEIYSMVFKSYPALQRFGWLLFRWATAILMIVAVLVVANTSGSEIDKFTLGYIVLDRAVSFVQCGLLVLLVLLARFVSFPWTSFAFGITLGLGLFASVELGTSAMKAQYGLGVAYDVLPSISMATYHGCVLFWVVSLLLPERQESRVTAASGYGLEHWNDTLQRLLNQ